MSVLSLEDFRHHRATSPSWAARRHWARQTRTTLTQTMADTATAARPWVLPTAAYTCFVVAAALLTPIAGWIVAGVCLTLAHAQASRA